MSAAPAFTPSRLIDSARLHFVCCAISDLYYLESDSTWEGNALRGAYCHHDGQGNFFALEWDLDHLLALVFDHESRRSEWDLDEQARDPRAHLTGVPAALDPLMTRQLEGYMCERLVTAGLWAVGERVTLPGDWETERRNGLWAFERFALDPAEAMLGETDQSWTELFSLEEPHARLAIALAARAADGPSLLAPEERVVLARPPEGAQLDRRRWGPFAEQLRAVGIAMETQ